MWFQIFILYYKNNIPELKYYSLNNNKKKITRGYFVLINICVRMCVYVRRKKKHKYAVNSKNYFVW